MHGVKVALEAERGAARRDSGATGSWEGGKVRSSEGGKNESLWWRSGRWKAVTARLDSRWTRRS